MRGVERDRHMHIPHSCARTGRDRQRGAPRCRRRMRWRKRKKKRECGQAYQQSAEQQGQRQCGCHGWKDGVRARVRVHAHQPSGEGRGGRAAGGQVQDTMEHQVQRVVQGPQVGGPVGVRQPPPEGKQARQELQARGPHFWRFLFFPFPQRREEREGAGKRKEKRNGQKPAVPGPSAGKGRPRGRKLPGRWQPGRTGAAAGSAVAPGRECAAGRESRRVPGTGTGA